MRAGANANSVTGLLSFSSHQLLSEVLYGRQKDIFSESLRKKNQETSDNSEEVKQSLIQIGKFSIGSKTCRSFRKTLKKESEHKVSSTE